MTTDEVWGRSAIDSRRLAWFAAKVGRLLISLDGEDAKDGYRVNLGCLEGLDPLALEISIIDGKALPVIEKPGCH